jgi:hypothetical protein
MITSATVRMTERSCPRLITRSLLSINNNLMGHRRELIP